MHILFNNNRLKNDKRIEIYIIISCNEKKIEAHTRIQMMGNVFFNVQQMSAQVITYIVLSIPLYLHLEHLNSSIHPHYKNVKIIYIILIIIMHTQQIGKNNNHKLLN